MKNITVKSTIRTLVAEELIRVCTAVTAAQRTTASGAKYTLEQVTAIRATMAGMWSEGSSQHTYFMKAFALMMNAPELEKTSRVFDLYTVVVLELNKSSHRYGVGEPRIVTHQGHGYCLSSDGSPDNTTFTPADKPRLATDEEIVKCIQSLTDAQWKTIMTHPQFHAITQTVMDSEVAVLVPAPEPELAMEAPSDDITAEAMAAKAAA